MEFPPRWPDRGYEIGCFLIVRLIRGIRIEAEKMQGSREDVIGGIEHVHAAAPELCKLLRLEYGVPTVDGALVSENLAGFLRIVADAGRTPHVIHRIGIAGIVLRQPLRDFGPRVN